MIARVGAAVRAARSAGRLPLLIGGDCPVILGALAALQDEAGQPGLLFVDGHEDAWPPLASPTGEAADCELGLALGLFDGDLDARLRAALPRIRPEHVVGIGPRDEEELAAAGIATLAGWLRALIRRLSSLPPRREPPRLPRLGGPRRCCPRHGGCTWTSTSSRPPA